MIQCKKRNCNCQYRDEGITKNGLRICYKDVEFYPAIQKCARSAKFAIHKKYSSYVTPEQQ
jgi:hypothetical protein